MLAHDVAPRVGLAPVAGPRAGTATFTPNPPRHDRLRWGTEALIDELVAEQGEDARERVQFLVHKATSWVNEQELTLDDGLRVVEGIVRRLLEVQPTTPRPQLRVVDQR
jgi:hypothetical protein